jgi:hypothetical protein
MPAEPNAPIVVGGCYRSGTSLLRRILDAHPRIHCGPEVKFFRDFYGDYIDDPMRHLRLLESARAMLPGDELFEIFGDTFVQLHERAARNAKKPRWADKVPENLVFLSDWERLLGDDWTLVHAVRNPLDTLASIDEMEFPASIPHGLDERIELYLEYNNAGLEFGERNHERYVRVVYEELVAQPEKTVRALMSALGERFDPRQLEINAGPHQTGLEDPKAAAPATVHAESVDRWRRDLSPAEIREIVTRTALIWPKLDPAGHWNMPLEHRDA